MKFKNGDEASFFKILLNASVDYVPLPPAFAKKYFENGNKKKKQTLFLKTKSADKLWRVKYVKIEDKYYFMDGWLEFVTDNRLKTGDFLVFWLLSSSPDSVFQVFFFASKGCLKHPISSSGAGDEDRKKPFVKEEKSDVNVNVNDDDDYLLGTGSVKKKKSLRGMLKKSYLYRMPLTLEFWKATGIDKYHHVQLRNEKGKIWKVNVSMIRSHGVPYLKKGWSDFRIDNAMKIQDMCEISHVKGNMLHVHVIKK